MSADLKNGPAAKRKKERKKNEKATTQITYLYHLK